mmetsp:Transcript_43655/g.64032  ORF Transcript_43655/g.64032 Transcript_43655/m.64032 type:complete len:521 (-) Transcript_43655:77-1639(-)
MMNTRIRAQMDISNPFSFRHIRNLKSIDVHSFDDRGACVVFASPGMLQSGVSRQLFDRWCTDPKNGVVVAGYAVEGTLAKEIMNEPKEVVSLEGRRQSLNCLVDYVSFSAHVDFMQNRDFINKVNPRHIILVHGQKDEMGRLKAALITFYRQLPESKRPSIIMPPNLQEVTLKFSRRRSAKVMGSLAENKNRKLDAGSTNKDGDEETTVAIKEGESVSGVLVTQNFNSKIVAPQDLSTYTQLRVGSVKSRLHVPFANQIMTLRLFLNEMFTGVTEVQEEEAVDADDSTPPSTTALGTVTVFGLHDDQVKIIIGKSRAIATIEWEASPVGDLLADAVIALIMHSHTSAASIRMTSTPCNHAQDPLVHMKQQQQPTKQHPDQPSAAKRIKHEENYDQPSSIKQDPQQLSLQESHLRTINQLLLEQFDTVKPTYPDAYTGSYEIETDSGLESISLENTNGVLRCTVRVEFTKEKQNMEDQTQRQVPPAPMDAKVTVECDDGKIASNIRECIRNYCVSAAPIKL